MQKFRDIHWKGPQDSPKQKLKVYRDTDKPSHIEVITDLHIKLPGKGHQDLLEVKVESGAESCLLLLTAFRRMFPGNLTTDGLPKPKAFQSTRHTILESYAESIPPLHDIVILKVAHYMISKLLLMRIPLVDIKKEVIILHTANTQLGLLKVLCHNRAAQCR